MGLSFSADEHRRVTEAVTAAERASDGEIITIVAERSDDYRDVALYWAILVMLGVPALLTLVSYEALERLLGWGWAAGPVYRELLSVVFVLEIIVFIVARLFLTWDGARLALTPRATRIGRVRRRAIALFRASAEKRTIGLTGVLIYLSLAERRAEIVADAAIHGRVDPAVWGEAMDALIARTKEGHAADGLVEAVNRVGVVLAEHFPRSSDDRNELADRLIEL